MAQQQQERIALVSYVSRELYDRVQRDAYLSNRSLAGQVRELLERMYNERPKVELRCNPGIP